MAQALLIVDDEMDGRTYEMDKTFKTVLSTKNLLQGENTIEESQQSSADVLLLEAEITLQSFVSNKNRRVLPIEIESIDREKLAQVDLTDLFMEACHLFCKWVQVLLSV